MSKSTKDLAEALAHESENQPEIHEAPGTAVLVIVLLVTFAVYYFANWKALADAWYVR
jgi:cytochrome c oxidase subunit I